MWIETCGGKAITLLTMVTPHAGVWIETNCGYAELVVRKIVTPHAGVWIETDPENIEKRLKHRHASCRRVD